MTVSIIAALARNRAIGRGNSLPWRIPEDLRRFKALTTGHTLVMGRRTYEAIGRPLPGRTTVVVTRRPLEPAPGVAAAGSIEEALRTARERESARAGERDGEVFIAGGAEIYAQTLGVADRMYLTVIDCEFEADTFFPPYDERDWTVRERVDRPPATDRPFAYAFLTLDRARA
jgi:dihydrofolate reductase